MEYLLSYCCCVRYLARCNVLHNGICAGTLQITSDGTSLSVVFKLSEIRIVDNSEIIFITCKHMKSI